MPLVGCTTQEPTTGELHYPKKSEVCHEAHARRRRKPPSCRYRARKGRQTGGRTEEGIAFEKGARPRSRGAFAGLVRFQPLPTEIAKTRSCLAAGFSACKDAVY